MCTVEAATAPQRQAGWPDGNHCGSFHRRERPTHGLASSKPGPLLDIGINAPRYHRETAPVVASPRPTKAAGAASPKASTARQNDSDALRGSTMTDPRAESSCARVEPPSEILPSGPLAWESTRIRSALPPG